MRKSLGRRSNERLYADFKQAAALLDDDQLVWSADLESIRKELARYLECKAGLGVGNNPHLINVVQSIIADENDIVIGD